MLYVYYGNDTHQVRAAALAQARALAGEEPLTTITVDGYEPGVLADAVGGSSLFGGAQVYVIDTPADVLADELAGVLAAAAESSDYFIVIEGALLAAAKKQYAKHAETVEEYTTKAERVDVFAINQALVQKDKRQLWLHLQMQLRAGIAPEEIIGVLWWQLKSLRLAALTNTAAEAGMKDFPYRKAQQGLRTMPATDAIRLSDELVKLYHQGHAGEVDLPTALEQWTLQL